MCNSKYTHVMVILSFRDGQHSDDIYNPKFATNIFTHSTSNISHNTTITTPISIDTSLCFVVFP